MNKSIKHQFALYSAQLPQNKTVTITDPELVQRIGKVLRLESGEIVTLFDGKQSADISIDQVTKKEVKGTVLSTHAITQLTPIIECIVPVLKREALEEVIYAAVELGANVIRLVVTEKVQRTWAGQKEFERLHGIMIAACEQSKQFMMPALSEPVDFVESMNILSAKTLFFDVNGRPAYDIITELRKENPAQVTMIIGPEADLTEEEKELLHKKKVIFCKLTPTVLRARQAFAVGLGMLRSML